MDSTSITIIVVVALFVLVTIASFLVFRQRAKVGIKAPGLKLEIDASDEKPMPTKAIEIEDAESSSGGILAEDETGGGVRVKRVKTQDDIIATTKPSQQGVPKE